MPQLDGVRALAVLSVVASHAQVRQLAGGGIGVDIFFVLSGFLITSLLIREKQASGTISFSAFYKRRAARLLPALVIVSLVSAPLFAIVRPYKTDAILIGVGTALLYISSWIRALGISSLGWFGHTWSLSVEEVFYALWPILFSRIVRLGSQRRVRAVVVLVFVIAVTYRLSLTGFGVSGNWQYNAPDARAEQLLAGCVVGVILPYFKPPSRWVINAWRLLVSVSCVFLLIEVIRPNEPINIYQGGSTVIAASASLVIAFLVSYPSCVLATCLKWRLFVWVGQRSYGIYLWHLPLLGLFDLRGWPLRDRVLGCAVALMLTPLIAALSYRYIELPFLRRGKSSRADVHESKSPASSLPA